MDQPAVVQHINQEGLKIIKTAEGCRLVAYRCPGGTLTIGWGHTLGVREAQRCTQAQADQWLSEDVIEAENAVRRYVDVPLNLNQFSALTSFVFNVGAGNFHYSTLLKRLNEGKYDEVPTQLKRWVYANKEKLPGLVERREKEAALFTSTAQDINWQEKYTLLLLKHNDLLRALRELAQEP